MCCMRARNHEVTRQVTTSQTAIKCTTGNGQVEPWKLRALCGYSQSPSWRPGAGDLVALRSESQGTTQAGVGGGAGQEPGRGHKVRGRECFVALA